MKFKKPNDFTTPAVQVAGFVAGIMGGRVVLSKIAQSDRTGKNTTLIKGGMALAGVGGSAFVQGADTPAVFVRSALMGLGADQVIGLIQGQVKDSSNATLRTAVGLNCPCQGGNNYALGYAEDVPLLGDYTPYYDNAYEYETADYNAYEYKTEAVSLTDVGGI